MSILLRRIHMYAGLFLAPWVLMYVVSTIVMNHRDHIGTGPLTFTKEYERPYQAVFDEDATTRQRTQQVLRDIGLDGAFAVGRPADDGTMVINRLDLVKPRRITYRPAAGTVLVESAESTAPQLLERMHRRRGLSQPYLTDRIWSVLVDGFVVTSVVWAFTGLWLWWELRVTRRFGALCLVIGLALWCMFLVTI